MMTLAEIEMMARERQRDLREEQKDAVRARKGERPRTARAAVLSALAAVLSIFTGLR